MDEKEKETVTNAEKIAEYNNLVSRILGDVAKEAITNAKDHNSVISICCAVSAVWHQEQERIWE